MTAIDKLWLVLDLTRLRPDEIGTSAGEMKGYPVAEKLTNPAV